MRNSDNGQPSAPAGQIAKWVARYRASDLSLDAFARAHHLPKARLHYWVYRKSRSASSPKPEPAAHFREVALPGLLGAPGWAAEICLPQGTTVRVAAHAPAEWIGALLQQLGRPC
jgi:hypothetical protein